MHGCWSTAAEDNISGTSSYWCVLTTVVGEGHIEQAPSSGCGVAMSEDKCEGKAKYIEVYVIRGKQVFPGPDT